MQSEPTTAPADPNDPATASFADSAADANPDDRAQAPAPASAPEPDPRTDAHASTLEAHASTLEQHASRLEELARWLRELEETIAERVGAVESALRGQHATGKPADAALGEPPATTAADPETGLQAGHAGPGTGDGPAGR